MSAGVKVAETSRDPSAVTSVIRHTVRVGSESRYEAWFREVTAIAQTFPGHRGVDFIRPPKGSRTYTVVLHFDTSEHPGRWLSSDARKRLIAEIEPYLEGGDQVEIRTGLEFWFTPPDSEQKHAKTYKQFLITWSVIFPPTIFVPWVLHPLFQTVPFLGLPGISNLLISTMIVGLLTYVIMPRYSPVRCHCRAESRALLRRAAGRDGPGHLGHDLLGRDLGRRQSVLRGGMKSHAIR